MNSKCLLNAYSFYFLCMHAVDYRIGIIEYVFIVSGICIFAWIRVGKKKFHHFYVLLIYEVRVSLANAKKSSCSCFIIFYTIE